MLQIFKDKRSLYYFPTFGKSKKVANNSRTTPPQMATNIKKYEFKGGLSQEFEIVDIAELYKKFEETITTTHRTGFITLFGLKEEIRLIWLISTQ